MSKIWLEQKLYILSNEDGSPTQFKNNEDLIVSLNGHNTGVPIENLFIGNKCTFYHEEGIIKGHSLIYKLDKEEINISLVDETGNKYIISKFRNPTIQASDKEVSDIDFKKAIDDLKSLSPAREDHPEAKVEELAATETEAPGLEFTEELSINEEYNKEVEELKSVGYTEKRAGNFSVIQREGEDPIIVRITPTDFFVVKDGKLDDGTIVEIVECGLKVTFPKYEMKVESMDNSVQK